jgi:serpin B
MHKTQNKIDHLVSSLDTRGASAVLTNAVYFHGKWATPFQPENTHDGPFHLEDKQTKTLPLMSQARQTYSYFETAQFQAASLPYGNGRASMVVVLPKDGVTLATVLTSLNADSWDATMTQFHPMPLAVTLPRFKVEYDASLGKPLASLGMASAFAPGADFAPMGLTHGVISDVVHKAVIEVSEQGTVAAAATGTMMRSLAMPVMRPPTVFRVDHPFFCVIRDTETGAVLFAGAIYDPEALGE